MLEKIKAKIESSVKGAVLDAEEVEGDDRLGIDKDGIYRVCKLLKEDNELGFRLLSDLTCVDYIEEDPRFEVVYQLYSLSNKYRLRLKVRVNEDDVLDSVSDIWRVADPLEREVWDMFGIKFENHPNLKRILMWEGFEGHPLRKDFPLKKHQSLIELRKEIEVIDDPPYNWTKYQKKRKLGLDK